MTRARPPLGALLGVGLLAGSTLALQVVLTRMFASVLFYHFGFLAISLALLGIGGGAILIYVRGDWFDRLPLRTQLARWSALYAVLLVVVNALIVRLDYTYEGVNASFVLNLGAACLLAALPFLAAGIAIGLAVRGYARAFGSVYAFDLAGAGLGALLIVPLMWLIEAPTLAVALGLTGAVASLLFAASSRDRSVALGAAAIAVVAVVIASATSFYALDSVGRTPDADRWTPISHVVAYQLGDTDRGAVIYDRVIGEMFQHKPGEPLPDWRKLQEGPESIAYQVAGKGDALIIGGGGGRDILNALSSSDRNVDVIELNRGVRDVVDKDMRDFTGAPYSMPRVSTTVGDGRSTLAHRDKHYGAIQIGFTDTFSSNSASGFALTENNLYTAEAVDEYLDHLAPGGVLTIARPVEHSGQEALRATVLALDAVRRRGADDPERHVAVVMGDYNAPFKHFFYGAVMVKNEPWTQPQLDRIRQLADDRGRGVGFAPGGPFQGDWQRLADAPDEQAFCEGYGLDVCPPTDDEPFFFHQKRLGDIFGSNTAETIGVPDPMIVLLVALGILGVLSGLAFVLPLLLVARSGRPPIGSLGFFAAIGVGYLVLEVVLIQRFVLFLGFPTYALSVVLFSMLVFTGLGALLTTRSGYATRRALTVALAAACGLIVLAAFALQPLLHTLIEAPFGARLAITVLLLAPLSVCLGMAMPIGIERLRGLYPGGVPWAWGVNGVMSVVASVLGVAVAINWGFTIATLVGLACYVGALLHAVRGRWPQAGSDDAEPTLAPADAPVPTGAPS